MLRQYNDNITVHEYPTIVRKTRRLAGDHGKVI